MDAKNRFVDRLMNTSTQNIRNMASPCIVEIAGTNRVLIENHRGVKAYGSDQIMVRVPYGCICITGCRLEVLRMTRDQLVISGVIKAVCLQSKEDA